MYIYIYGYTSNTYSLPNFSKNFSYALLYASDSTYPLPFTCNTCKCAEILKGEF